MKRPNGYLVKAKANCDQCLKLCHSVSKGGKVDAYYIHNKKKLCRECAKENGII